MLQKYFFFMIIVFFSIIILLKNSSYEKFYDLDIILLKKGNKCEQCCNQLQSNSDCAKKCIFDGAICRCCNNN